MERRPEPTVVEQYDIISLEEKISLEITFPAAFWVVSNETRHLTPGNMA